MNHWKGNATLSDKEFFRQKEESRLQGAHIISLVGREGEYFVLTGWEIGELNWRPASFTLQISA